MLFVYRLALALGYPSPEHLLAGPPPAAVVIPLGTWFGKHRQLRFYICQPGLTSSQLAGWMAYAAIEPFGEYRSELRHGQQMALQANINRDSKRKPQPYAPAEFMNFVDSQEEERSEPTQEEIEAKLERIFG